MFYQTRYPSANKWATLGSFKVNAVYQKLAQNLWVKRYGGPQLSQQGLFFSRQNHFRGHGKKIYTHSNTTFHHGEIILANLLTCHQHAKCYGNNPTYMPCSQPFITMMKFFQSTNSSYYFNKNACFNIDCKYIFSLFQCPFHNKNNLLPWKCQITHLFFSLCRFYIVMDKPQCRLN